MGAIRINMGNNINEDGKKSIKGFYEYDYIDEKGRFAYRIKSRDKSFSCTARNMREFREKKDEVRGRMLLYLLDEVMKMLHPDEEITKKDKLDYLYANFSEYLPKSLIEKS